MKVPASFDCCTICNKNKPLTSEHIIPESVGGTLEAEIQCVDCNSKLGSELVFQAKQDPVLRLAIQQLKDKLPDLYLSMEEGQRYWAKDASGKAVPVKLKKGKFQTQAHRRNDGSLILDTRKAEKNLRTMLAKEGLEYGQINESLRRLKESPDNVRVRLSNQRSAIKWTVISSFPTLEKPEMSPRLVAMIAYNYLCLLIGNDVFNEWFAFMRDFILTGKPTDRIKIESFTSRNYECYHRLYCEFDDEEARVKIVFFGWLLYVVHIAGFVYKGPDFVYVEDLKNKRGLLAESIELAKQGEFYSTKKDTSGVNSA
jgi:hypothetical protein